MLFRSLGENGSGKSTALQALALLLVGPEGAPHLQSLRPSWLREEQKPGLLSTHIQQNPNDSGLFDADTQKHTFRYSYQLTGNKPLEIGNRLYNIPSVIGSPNRDLRWLRKSAFTPTSRGWFVSGYGAYRRSIRTTKPVFPELPTL